MTKLEQKALKALSAWLNEGVYRQSTPAEGALLDAAVALEAKRTGKTEREVMNVVLAVPSPLEQHRAETKLRDRLRASLNVMTGDRGPEFRQLVTRLIERATFTRETPDGILKRKRGSEDIVFERGFVMGATYEGLAAVLASAADDVMTERRQGRAAS